MSLKIITAKLALVIISISALSADLEIPADPAPALHLTLSNNLEETPDSSQTSVRELRERIAAQPADPELRYRLARALSYSEEYAEALSILRELVSSYPDNADYLLGLGQVLLWSGDPGLALPHLQKAKSLAPDYEDVYRVLGQVYERLDMTDTADELYAEAALRFGPKQWQKPLRDRLYAGRRGLELQVSLRIENPSNLARDWRDARVALINDYGQSRQLGIFFADSDRFSLGDSMVGLGGYHPLSESLIGFAEYSYSPTHRVMAEHSLHMQLNQVLQDGWGVIGGIKLTDYVESTVLTTELTLEKYLADFRFAYSAYLSSSNTAGDALSHRFQAGYYYSGENSLQFAVTTGKEVEKPTDATTLITTDFTGISLWGEHWITRRWALTFALGYTDIEINNRVNAHRSAITIGTNIRF